MTDTRTVAPTSGAVSVYDEDVAPSIPAQFAPAASQRVHAYANDVGEFLQVPDVDVSICPAWGVPVTDGGARVVGTSPVLLLPPWLSS